MPNSNSIDENLIRFILIIFVCVLCSTPSDRQAHLNYGAVVDQLNSQVQEARLREDQTTPYCQNCDRGSFAPAPGCKFYCSDCVRWNEGQCLDLQSWMSFTPVNSANWRRQCQSARSNHVSRIKGMIEQAMLHALEHRYTLPLKYRQLFTTYAEPSARGDVGGNSLHRRWNNIAPLPNLYGVVVDNLPSTQSNQSNVSNSIKTAAVAPNGYHNRTNNYVPPTPPNSPEPSCSNNARVRSTDNHNFRNPFAHLHDDRTTTSPMQHVQSDTGHVGNGIENAIDENISEFDFPQGGEESDIEMDSGYESDEMDDDDDDLTSPEIDPFETGSVEYDQSITPESVEPDESEITAPETGIVSTYQMSPQVRDEIIALFTHGSTRDNGHRQEPENDDEGVA